LKVRNWREYRCGNDFGGARHDPDDDGYGCAHGVRESLSSLSPLQARVQVHFPESGRAALFLIFRREILPFALAHDLRQLSVPDATLPT